MSSTATVKQNNSRFGNIVDYHNTLPYINQRRKDIKESQFNFRENFDTTTANSTVAAEIIDTTRPPKSSSRNASHSPAASNRTSSAENTPKSPSKSPIDTQKMSTSSHLIPTADPTNLTEVGEEKLPSISNVLYTFLSKRGDASMDGIWRSINDRLTASGELKQQMDDSERISTIIMYGWFYYNHRGKTSLAHWVRRRYLFYTTCKRVFYFEGVNNSRYKQGVLAPYLPHKCGTTKYLQPIVHIKECVLNDFSNAMKFVVYTDRALEKEFTAKGELFILYEYYLREVLREVMGDHEKLVDLYIWYRNSVNNIRDFRIAAESPESEYPKTPPENNNGLVHDLSFLVDSVHCYYPVHMEYNESQKRKIKKWLDEKIGRSNTSRLINIVSAVAITIGRTIDVVTLYVINNDTKCDELLNELFAPTPADADEEDFLYLDPLRSIFKRARLDKGSDSSPKARDANYNMDQRKVSSLPKMFDEAIKLREKANDKMKTSNAAVVTNDSDPGDKRRTIFEDSFQLYMQSAHKVVESGSFDWKPASNAMIALYKREDTLLENAPERPKTPKIIDNQEEHDKSIMTGIMKIYSYYCLSNFLGFESASIYPYGMKCYYNVVKLEKYYRTRWRQELDKINLSKIEPRMMCMISMSEWVTCIKIDHAYNMFKDSPNTSPNANDSEKIISIAHEHIKTTKYKKCWDDEFQFYKNLCIDVLGKDCRPIEKPVVEPPKEEVINLKDSFPELGKDDILLGEIIGKIDTVIDGKSFKGTVHTLNTEPPAPSVDGDVKKSPERVKKNKMGDGIMSKITGKKREQFEKIAALANNNQRFKFVYDQAGTLLSTVHLKEEQRLTMFWLCHFSGLRHFKNEHEITITESRYLAQVGHGNYGSLIDMEYHQKKFNEIIVSEFRKLSYEKIQNYPPLHLMYMLTNAEAITAQLMTADDDDDGAQNSKRSGLISRIRPMEREAYVLINSLTMELEGMDFTGIDMNKAVLKYPLTDIGIEYSKISYIKEQVDKLRRDVCVTTKLTKLQWIKCAEYNKLEASAKQLAETLKGTEKDRDDKDKEWSRSQKEVKRLKNERDALKTERDTLKVSFESLNKSNADLLKRFKIKTVKTTALDELLTAYCEDVKNTKKEKSELEKQLSKNTKASQEYEKVMNKSKADNERLLKEIKKDRTKLQNELRTTKAKLTKELEEARDAKKSMKEQLDAFEKERSRLLDRDHELVERIATRDAQIGELEGHLEDWENRPPEIREKIIRTPVHFMDAELIKKKFGDNLRMRSEIDFGKAAKLYNYFAAVIEDVVRDYDLAEQQERSRSTDEIHDEVSPSINSDKDGSLPSIPDHHNDQMTNGGSHVQRHYPKTVTHRNSPLDISEKPPGLGRSNGGNKLPPGLRQPPQMGSTSHGYDDWKRSKSQLGGSQVSPGHGIIGGERVHARTPSNLPPPPPPPNPAQSPMVPEPVTHVGSLFDPNGYSENSGATGPSINSLGGFPTFLNSKGEASIESDEVSPLNGKTHLPMQKQALLGFQDLPPPVRPAVNNHTLLHLSTNIPATIVLNQVNNDPNNLSPSTHSSMPLSVEHLRSASRNSSLDGGASLISSELSSTQFASPPPPNFGWPPGPGSGPGSAVNAPSLASMMKQSSWKNITENSRSDNGRSSGGGSRCEKKSRSSTYASRPSFLGREHNHIDERWFDFKYVFDNYKISLCPNGPACKFYRKEEKIGRYMCPYYHSDDDRRRKIDRPQQPKSQHYYKALPCKYAEIDKGTWKTYDVTRCKDKDACMFAHSKFEIQYHPLPWKSRPCKDSETLGKCPRLWLCAYKHKDDEKWGYVNVDHLVVPQNGQ